MRRILIIGAGQSGLQLGLSLLAEGYDVTIMSARTPEQIRTGRVMSTQAMFGPALRTEREYGLDLWEKDAPRVDSIHLTLSAPPGEHALSLTGRLDEYASSTDQRLKMAAWLELFEERGGIVHYQGVTTTELDALARSGYSDLTIVATGRGELTSMFDRDPARSPYDAPQRSLAVAYVNGLRPDPAVPGPRVEINVVPGHGELVVIPALTHGGPCDILFWEAVPDGPVDLWREPHEPAEHLRLTLDLARRYAPWVYERCHDVELTDAGGTLSGRFAPTVRRPVAVLPSGGLVLGMADAVVANDPLTGQGSNTAAKCSAAYLAAILARGTRPFDRSWMEQTFEQFWTDTAEPSTTWTNLMLGPPPEHVRAVLAAAAQNDAVARRFANLFADPTDTRNWFINPTKTTTYLASLNT